MLEPSQFVRVKRILRFVAKKTTKKYKKGRLVSKAYAKRHPHLIKRTQWLEFEERQAKFDPVLKHQVYKGWKVTHRERLTMYEHILHLKKFSDRSLCDTFARGRIYSKIWQNTRGSIRVTINGLVLGRRVKEVLHIGYLRNLWEHKHNGYEKFKDYLTHKILNALRRRGLRLSNAKESQGRLVMLRKRRKTVEENLKVIPHWMRKDEKKKLASIVRSIHSQRLSSQITSATIRIEKLVP